jgi:hypothetical protein
MIRLLHHCPSIRQCAPSDRGASFPQIARQTAVPPQTRHTKALAAEAPRIILDHPAVPQYLHASVSRQTASYSLNAATNTSNMLSSGTAGSTESRAQAHKCSWLPRAHRHAADPARTKEGSVSQTSPDTELPKRVIVTATRASETRDTSKWSSRVSWPAFEPSNQSPMLRGDHHHVAREKGPAEHW